MICTQCGKQEGAAEIFMFVPGTNDRGMTNTVIIAYLCEMCVDDLIHHRITIPAPMDALEWKDLLK